MVESSEVINTGEEDSDQGLDIRMVIYEAVTPQCGRSVVQVLVVRVVIGVVTYEAVTPSVGGQ